MSPNLPVNDEGLITHQDSTVYGEDNEDFSFPLTPTESYTRYGITQSPAKYFAWFPPSPGPPPAGPPPSLPSGAPTLTSPIAADSLDPLRRITLPPSDERSTLTIPSAPERSSSCGPSWGRLLPRRKRSEAKIRATEKDELDAAR
ncbi:hypothetical protein JCM16303_003410 [Sporobolomyces ruberrimus]